MPGTGLVETSVHRLVDAVCDAIVASSERLLVAEGMAIFTVFDPFGSPRIELTSTALVATGVGRVQTTPPSRRLPGEIDILADAVRRKLLGNAAKLDGARQIRIVIALSGPRPQIELQVTA